MKSRTSSFNRAVLRKDITRFFPVWGLYLVYILLNMLTGPFYIPQGETFAGALLSSLPSHSFVNAVYALICANLLFGDLFKSRLCNGLHAMPLRRGTWLLSHVCAGFLFSIVPNLITTLLMLPRCAPDLHVPFLWLVSMQLQFAYFFGLAVLCVFCVGKTFGLVLLYFIANFFTSLLEMLIQVLYIPLLPGFSGENISMIADDPLFALIGKSGAYSFGKEEILSAWCYLGSIAVLGLTMILITLLLYRRRNLERAGDFIILRPIASILGILVSLCCGSVFYIVSYTSHYLRTSDYSADPPYFSLFLGCTIGFWCYQMLQKRTVKVFNLKPALAYLSLLAFLVGSLLLTARDPLGITKKVPEASSVAGIELGEYYVSATYEFTDPNAIAEISHAHRLIIDSGFSAETDDTVGISIRYSLKNGGKLTRTYEIDPESEAAQILESYFSHPGFIFEGRTLDELREYAYYVTVTDTGVAYRDEIVQSLVEAIWADCEAGSMAQQEALHSEGYEDSYYIHLKLDVPDSSEIQSLYLRVYPEAENTMTWLRENHMIP